MSKVEESMTPQGQNKTSELYWVIQRNSRNRMNKAVRRQARNDVAFHTAWQVISYQDIVTQAMKGSQLVAFW